MYVDGELPDQANHSIGDAYIYNDIKYIYLGSGLAESGGSAPELPMGAVPFLGMLTGLGFVKKRKK